MFSSHKLFTEQHSSEQQQSHLQHPALTITHTQHHPNHNHKIMELEQQNVIHALNGDIDHVGKQDTWEKFLLEQLAGELIQPRPNNNIVRGIEYQGDRLARPINQKFVHPSSSKNKKKGFEKFKAYAAKMKIPSYQDIRKTPQINSTNPFDSTHSHIPPHNTKHVDWIEDICQPKLAVAAGTQKIAFNYERKDKKSDNVVRREIKSSLQYRKAVKRKSVNTKKKEEDVYVSKKIEQTYNRIIGNSSPKNNLNKLKSVFKRDRDQDRESVSQYATKKVRVKIEQESVPEQMTPQFNHNIFSNKMTPLKKHSRYQPESNVQPYLQQSPPPRQTISRQKSAFRSSVESPVYLEKGINFKQKSIGNDSRIANQELHKKDHRENIERTSRSQRQKEREEERKTEQIKEQEEEKGSWKYESIGKLKLFLQSEDDRESKKEQEQIKIEEQKQSLVSQIRAKFEVDAKSMTQNQNYKTILEKCQQNHKEIPSESKEQGKIEEKQITFHEEKMLIPSQPQPQLPQLPLEHHSYSQPQTLQTEPQKQKKTFPQMHSQQQLQPPLEPKPSHSRLSPNKLNQRINKYSSNPKLARNQPEYSPSPGRPSRQKLTKSPKPKLVQQQKKVQERTTKKQAKLLIFNSQDKYISKILIERGWLINTDLKSRFYHLKWIFKPLPQDYNSLSQLQFINHVKNSHQLTSKNYLNKNLIYNRHNWCQLDKFYPKCYDLSKKTERQDFKAEYISQFMTTLLRNIYTYIRETKPYEVHKYSTMYQKLLQQDGNYCTNTKYISTLRKKQFRTIDLENYRFHDEQFSLNINLLLLGLKYWRMIRKKEELEEDYCQWHFLNFNQKQTTGVVQQKLSYLRRGQRLKYHIFHVGFIKEYYSTPSELTIQRIVKQYIYFQRKLEKQWSAYGHNNIWIVKPCSASRGNGIYLQNNLYEILKNAKGIQSRIVQKYIQKPLLFSTPSLLKNKKFDIRQWVLLRSINPLQIYMFSHCYIRICSQQYLITNINNLKSHLTNYTFNKKSFKNKQESVMDYDRFKDLLLEQFGVDYESTIKPKIKDIIVNSIKSAQEHLSDYNKRCFSLLGYDILLDGQFNPWLLEVNMSPACEERTQWLKEYLLAMGQGMLNIVLPDDFMERRKYELNRQFFGTSVKPKLQPIASQNFQRIQTDISQELPLCQTASFKPNQQAEPQNGTIPQHFIHKKQSSLQYTYQNVSDNISQSYIQIDYNKFIAENVPQTSDGCYPDGNKGMEQGNGQGKAGEPGKKLKSQSFSLYNSAEEQSSDSQEQQQNQKTLPNQRHSQQLYHHLDPSLKWQQICFQQYPFPNQNILPHTKKQPQQLPLEIIGTKISPHCIKENDVRIDQYEETKDEVERSVVKLQRKMRIYLDKKKQKQSKDNQRIIENKDMRQIQRYKMRKINFSRIGRNYSQRHTKSTLFEQFHRNSIWHYNYQNTYRDMHVQRKKIQKVSTSQLSRYSYNHQLQRKKSDKEHNQSSRSKMKSLLFNHMGNQPNNDLQQIVLDDRQIEQKVENVRLDEMEKKQGMMINLSDMNRTDRPQKLACSLQLECQRAEIEEDIHVQ